MKHIPRIFEVGLQGTSHIYELLVGLDQNVLMYSRSMIVPGVWRLYAGRPELWRLGGADGVRWYLRVLFLSRISLLQHALQQ